MSDLDELKTLLFGAEKEVLDSIQQRVQRPEARAADVAAVLPEAIRLRHQEDDELVDSLRDPVGRCMRDAIHAEPDEFADALYPVIGPAIRKSIAHAMKTFSEQINRTLEHSLTVKGLKWRIQAARAGIPFANYVIQRSLLYRVEQAYLISRENGLLIGHVHHDASHIKDSDAVSAMFTAIQDFVKESFSPDRSGRLETADMGEFTLWAVHGPHALLVCVIRGVPPRGLRNDLNRILEQTHFRYGDGLRDYAGDTSSVAGIEEELERCLLFEAARQPTDDERKPNWPAIVIVALLAVLLGYAAWIAWRDAQQLEQLEAAIGETPGLYIADIEHDDGVYSLYGLRDPLAAELSEIAARAGLRPEQLQGELRPYRSLDEEMLFRRLRRELQPEAGITMSLEDGAATVRGTATGRWLEDTQRKIATVDFGLPVNIADVALAEWPALEERATQLDGTAFYFVENLDLSEESVDRLALFASAASELAEEAGMLGGNLMFRVTGYTDGTGSRELNEILAGRRADSIVQALLAAGLEPSQVSVAGQSANTATTLDQEMRRAMVTVTLIPPGS